MEIISSGTYGNKKSILFKCSKCGCQFRADEGEYHKETNQIGCTPSLTYYVYSTIFSYYYANCPECHRMCSEVKEDPGAIYTTYSSTGTSAGDTVLKDHVTITCNNTDGDTDVKST